MSSATGPGSEPSRLDGRGHAASLNSPSDRLLPFGEGGTIWKGLRVFVAAIILVALLASGAAAGDSALPYDEGGGGLASARFAVRVLKPGAIQSAAARIPDPARLYELVHEARMGGLDPQTIAGSSFPDSAAIIAMLSDERDLDDYQFDAGHGGRAGEFYHGEIGLLRQVRPLFRSYVNLFTSAYDALGGPSIVQAHEAAIAAKMRHDILPYSRDLGITPPPRSQLPYAHPYALDLFFDRVRHLADGQEGLPIPSLSAGIVVASARDWNGGAGIETWRGGGLSPSAGNGVVIYDPSSRRFFSYFHMRSTDLSPGDIVYPGETLGIGGNTGMNARRPGHGGHVHVEIFDAENESSLNSYRILDLVRGR